MLSYHIFMLKIIKAFSSAMESAVVVLYQTLSGSE